MGFRAAGVKINRVFVGNAAISVAAEKSVKTLLTETEQ